MHARLVTRAVPRVWTSSLPQGIAVSAAVFFAAMYVVTAIPRILYPYDLDFIEDSLLMQALRFAQGQPVFVPPNADFDPHVYMPLYAWLGGLLFNITGPSFVPLRLLSFGATLATASLIYWIAHRESGLRWIAMTCAGLLLGGYRISGFWYELARVDSLFVALALAGLTAGIYAPRAYKGWLLAACLAALAFFTKQTGLLVGAGLAGYLFLVIGRRAWVFVTLYGALIVLPLLAANGLTDGWFFYHIFRLASGDPVEAGRVVRYVAVELFGQMAGLSLTTMVAVILGLRRRGRIIFLDQPWLVGMAAAIIISGTGRASVGGNLNNLMPAYALLCLAPALLVREWRHQPQDDVWSRWRNPLLAGIVLLQLTLGAYYPPRYIPTAAMRASGDRLIQRIASLDGQVLVMMHPYYALLAGKEPAAQIAALWYVRERGQRPLPADFVRRIQGQYYSAIISDESFFETEPVLQDLIEKYYAKSQILAVSEAPPTTTGMAVRPQVIYLPRQP